jgi:hypothetical protein
MRKRCILALLLGSALMLMTGCSLDFNFGRSGEDSTESTEDGTEVVTTINVDIPEEDKLLVEMTREELEALSASEIKELFEAQLPNYREIYGIEDDYEMQEGDWLTLRGLLEYQLYGVEETAADITTAAEPETENNDPDRIYYAPTVEEITAMSTADFAAYLNAMCAYYGTGTDIDFTQLSEEVLEERRAALIETIQNPE